MSTTTTPDSTPQEQSVLLQQLETLRKTVEAEQCRARRSSQLTAIVGAALLLVVTGYFLYAYNRISAATQPEVLVSVAETMIDDNLPVIRQSLEKEIAQSAPQWAEGLSRKAQEAMPDMRKKAVAVLTDEAEAKLEEASVLSEKTFREFLVNNKPVLEQKYKELATSPQLAEKSLLELELPLDRQVSEEMRQQLEEVVRNVTAAERNLRRLQSAKDLTAEQRVERDVWMLVRRLQMEHLNEAERMSKVKRPLKKETPTKEEGKKETSKGAAKKDSPKEKEAPKGEVSKDSKEKAAPEK
jgi:hypothetical protein